MIHGNKLAAITAVLTLATGGGVAWACGGGASGKSDPGAYGQTGCTAQTGATGQTGSTGQTGTWEHHRHDWDRCRTGATGETGQTGATYKHHGRRERRHYKRRVRRHYKRRDRGISRA